MKPLYSILTAIALIVTPLSIHAAAMTNADVVKMVNAKLDDGVILSAMQNSENKFDASPDGLIALSNAKVPAPIIEAIIKRVSSSSAPAPSQTTTTTTPTPAASATTNLYSPNEVIMLDGNKTISMQYITPGVRTAARAFGLGGVATYSVLRGTAANTRTANPQPSFLVSVPERAQPESYVTIAHFAVRRNDSREVLIGGGYMSYSTGITKDRVVNCTSEKANDQSRAQKGFVIYKLTPRGHLAPGEYAVILYTAEMSQMVSGWFSGGGNSYFDFGVDP